MNTRLIEPNRVDYTGVRNENSREEQLVCFKCSTSNPFHNSFCNRCGAKLLKPLGSVVDEEESPSVVQRQTRTELRPTGASVNPPKANMPVQPLRQSAIPYHPNNMPSTTSAPNVARQPFNPNMSGRTGRTIPSNTPLKLVTTASATTPGYSLYGSNVSVVSDEDFIQKNPFYYRQKFAELRRKNKKFSWNWAASRYGLSWCFYRKMYKIGFILLGIQMLGFLHIFLFPVTFFLVNMALAMFGNYFYMRHTEKMLQKAQNIPELQRYAYIQKKGGTSLIAAILERGFLVCALMVWVFKLSGAESLYDFFLYY